MDIQIYANYNSFDGITTSNVLIAENSNIPVQITGKKYIYIYIYIHTYIDNTFTSESSISFLGTAEIEKENTYSFSLYPNVTLQPTAIIEITFSTYLQNTGSCLSNIGGCTFNTNKITLNSPYPTGYPCCYLTQFEISGLINPKYAYLYSDILFNISATDDTGILVQRNGMQLYSPSASTKYSPHLFTPTLYVIGANYSTIKITEYLFSFINKDYAISSGHIIKIVLPTGMFFTQSPPSVAVQSGLITPLTNSGSSTELIIERGFDGDISANTNIQFIVGDIQNPYEMSISPLVFRVYIYSSTYIEYFVDNSDLV